MGKTNANGRSRYRDTREVEKWNEKKYGTKESKSMHGSIVTSKKCAASLNNGKFAKSKERQQQQEKKKWTKKMKKKIKHKIEEKAHQPHGKVKSH